LQLVVQAWGPKEMDRPIQPVLMVAGCAVLLVAAIALPVVILQPAGQVELVSVRQTPIAEIPVRPPPAAEAPVVNAPVAQAPVEQAPIVEGPDAKAPVAPAPPTKPPTSRSRRSKAPPPAEIAEGDGLSRGQRFRIVQQEALKALGPEAALSSALARAFVFPTTRSDAVFGIDVNHYTTENCGCQIDWDRIANQKVAFVYAKATEGVSYKDPTFDKHWRELGKRPNLHRGAYHFLRADVEIEAQVKKFLDRMGTLQPGDLPPAMDLEWDVYRDSTRKWQPKDGNDYWSNLEPDEILARALKWLQLVERETGRVPIVYTSRMWWMQRIKDESKLELLKRYPIWLSAMEDEDLRLEKPGAKGRWAGKWNWTLWQFTNMGDLTKGGIPNPKAPTDERMDVSIFPGDLGQFQQAVGISATIVVADNKVPATQNTDTGGVAPAEPQKEPPKDAQVAENPPSNNDAAKPTEPSGSGPPATGGSTVTPPESQNDPPKENQVAENPPSGGNTVKPEESNAANVFANPTTGGGVVAPVEPAEPPKDPPKENQVTSAPSTDGNTSKPAESNDSNVVANPPNGGVVVAPAEPVETQKDPPKENQLADAPVPSDNAARPSESDRSDAAATPATANGTVVPAEPQKDPVKDTQVSETPAADSNANKPDETTGSNVAANPQTNGGTAIPAEPQKEPPKETQVASLPEADKPVASNSGTGAPNDVRVPNNPPSSDGADSGNVEGSKPSPTGELSAKPTIEIVLKNGRVLRVEEDIDPAVLSRLIALIEK
jgi:lysozyme